MPHCIFGAMLRKYPAPKVRLPPMFSFGAGATSRFDFAYPQLISSVPTPEEAEAAAANAVTNANVKSTKANRVRFIAVPPCVNEATPSAHPATTRRRDAAQSPLVLDA